MTTRKMTVADWIKVEDNPIQRDTERHAAKAKHLKTPLPIHAFVFACELPSGKLIKLDGHTRALLWQRKQVADPGVVEVGIVPAKDRAHAEELYKGFDSREALETLRDKVSGAFHRFGFEPDSGLLQTGNITNALRVAYAVLLGGAASQGNAGVTRTPGRTDVYTMINEFSPELLALDGLGLRQGQMGSGIMSAFLLSFRKYGHKITPFWVGVVGDKGSKIDGEMDAIQAVNQMILAKRGNYGGSHNADLCNRALMGVEKWLKDLPLSTIPRPLDTTGYFDGWTRPPERLIKKNDIGKPRVHA